MEKWTYDAEHNVQAAHYRHINHAKCLKSPKLCNNSNGLNLNLTSSIKNVCQHIICL